jgi:CheY-like chemotaxis protein
MTKIMLVEDDKSLREIYGVRLLAEGYDIVSAGDGEEALAMAIKERPQLIVSDVMMPKISGFDMLDIIRSTTETRDIKVIMMTALSSEDQRSRGESLGADRYLVKSQVGIEDVVRVVHEVLGDSGAPKPAPAAAPAAGEPAAPSAPAVPQPAAPVAPQPVPMPPEASLPPQPVSAPQGPTETPKPASIKNRVIEPITDPNAQQVDINQLLDKELAREAGVDPDGLPTVQTTAEERQTLEQELANFQTDGGTTGITTEPGDPAEQNQAQENSSFPPPPPPPTPPIA